MKIRKATKKDAFLLAEINMAAEHPGDIALNIPKKWFVDKFKRKMNTGHVEFYLLDKKGFAAINKAFPGHEHAEVYWIAIDKKYQRQGIGSKLLKFAEKRAKEHKLRAVYLYTPKTNKPAQDFYKKHKYKKINEFPNFYSNGDASILFGKKLK